MAPQGYAAGYYAPYYDQLAKVTQQQIAPENNSYEAFRPAPASDSLLINRVPVSALPSGPTLLQKAIADAVRLSTGIAVGGARTPLPWDRITKLSTSLVIQVPPTDAPILIKMGTLLFNRARPVRACGQLHLPPNALSAGVSVTQLLAARKSTPNAAASVATPRTQPEPTHATNALQSQPC